MSDLDISVPGGKVVNAGVVPERHCKAYFDGGSRGKVGTTGYIAFLPNGGLWFGAGHLVASFCTTNNEAEMAAMSALLEEIAAR